MSMTFLSAPVLDGKNIGGIRQSFFKFITCLAQEAGKCEVVQREYRHCHSLDRKVSAFP